MMVKGYQASVIALLHRCITRCLSGPPLIWVPKKKIFLNSCCYSLRTVFDKFTWKSFQIVHWTRSFQDHHLFLSKRNISEKLLSYPACYCIKCMRIASFKGCTVMCILPPVRRPSLILSLATEATLQIRTETGSFQHGIICNCFECHKVAVLLCSQKL